MKYGWINRLRLTFKALSIEDETSLAYIQGNLLESIPTLKSKKKFTGIFYRTLIFFRFLLVGFRFKNPLIYPVDFLFYSGSFNQFSSMKSTMSGFSNKSYLNYYNPVIKERMRVEGSRSVCLSFGFLDLIITFLVFFIRAPRLYKKLKNKDPAAIYNYFNVYCMSYIYLPTFFSLIEKSKCIFVINSNDHSVANRSLRIAAELLGIKNVYMQHASVSSYFPALQYDYAFLDGKASLDVYSHCLGVSRTEVDAGARKKINVFLSGQKKQLHRNIKSANKKYIGIALNPLDEIDGVIGLLDALISLNKMIVIRLHPAQSSIFLSSLESYVAKKLNIKLQLSVDSLLTEFFEGALFLVAGNSSIHLEASVFGLSSYYHEFSYKVDHPDYYGFLKNGLIEEFPLEDLCVGKNSIENLTSKIPDVCAVQLYSTTYGTSWQGREGELVAQTILNIKDQVNLNKLYERCFESRDYCIYNPINNREFN